MALFVLGKLSGSFIMSYCGSMTQLQLIATDNADVNPPEKLLSDGGTLPGKASSTTDSENRCFHL